jgi:hypothetical protein
MSEEKQQPDLERGLTTDIIVPVIVAGAPIVYDQIKNRPPKEEPPKIELPPGVEE